MARKTLLNEGEIRKFMKLANLGPLSENFLDEVEDEEMEVEDEVAVEEPMDLGGEDEVMDAEAELEMPMDEPEVEDDSAGELSPEVQAQVEDALTAFLQGGDAALAEEFPELAGIMSVETDEEPVEDEVVDAEMEMGPAGDELEMTMDMGEMPDGDLPEDEAAMMQEITKMQEKLQGLRESRAKKDTKKMSQTDLVNEVTQRVTKRLLAESKREQMSDKIAENVIKRIQALKSS
tara:strand:+ start:1544 stop:2245 length:702 start_codon:yes stop_codon:yes gene_type:complete